MSEQKVTERTTCRVCGSDRLTTVLNLGSQYVSDFVPAEDIHTQKCSKCGGTDEYVYGNDGYGVVSWECGCEGGRVPRLKCPIELQLCRDCTLVQQRYTAPQDFLYTRHYWYRSGTTDTMRAALQDVVMGTLRRVHLEPGDVVLDIGANDGTLLSFWSNDYFSVPPHLVRVGVEPASNLIEECGRKCTLVIPEFWSFKAYTDVALLGPRVGTNDFGTKRAKVVTALGMFYDLEDPNQFIADVAKVLHPQGVFVAQLMCLKQTVEQADVGNFAHEHLEFYSLRSLVRLFDNHGLEIFDLEENAVNGGSYRLYVRHKTEGLFGSDAAERMLKAVVVEGPKGAWLSDQQVYRDLGYRLQKNRDKCVGFVRNAVAAGKRVWVYGASTKGNVILQYYGLDHTVIEAAADRSPEKVGLYTAGTGIPIRSEDEFRKAAPDYALVLPYSFIDEFVTREAAWRAGGGKFLVPLPEFRVV